MWATEPPAGHEGITGVTFDSDGHRLLGVLYLARGEEPKPTVLLLHGCPGLEQNLDLAAGCATAAGIRWYSTTAAAGAARAGTTCAPSPAT